MKNFVLSVLASLSVVGTTSARAPAKIGHMGHPYDPSYQRGAIEGFELVSHLSAADVLASSGKVGAATEKATYRSPAMRMTPGQVIFTDPNNTPLRMPGGSVAITSFNAQIVDAQGSPVPLSEVYLHHWLIFDGFGNAGVCGGYLGYKFGVGAESRNTDTTFPDGYAMITSGKERWGANIHVLRTDGVPDVKSCIECHCEGGGGNFGCCPDGSFCDTTKGIDHAPREYFLEYTIEYSTDTSAYTAIDITVLDVSQCQIEYNVPQCSAPPCVSSLAYQTVVPADIDVVFMIGHLHIGGINLTVTADLPDGTTAMLCNSEPRYGTGSEAGNEKGYVVEMDGCSWGGKSASDNDHDVDGGDDDVDRDGDAADGAAKRASPRSSAPLRLPAGSKINYVANYNNDPYHDAVMGLVYVASIAPNGGKIYSAADPRRWFGHAGFTAVFIAFVASVFAAIGAAIYARRRHAASSASIGDFRPLNEL